MVDCLDLSLGTSSKNVIVVLIVPPDIPPLALCAVTDEPTFSGEGIDLRVLFERYAQTSEGIESYPQEGMMIAPDLFAAKS